MRTNQQEIELKLKIDNKDEVIAALEQLGAVFQEQAKQRDRFFNAAHTKFGEGDQALRLRSEEADGTLRGYLTFKGTPTYTQDGHKVRDEFETVVDPEAMEKILGALGFSAEEITVEKRRSHYQLSDLDIFVDELAFGTFLELEGSPEEIEAIRAQLPLASAEVMKGSYYNYTIEHQKRAQE